MNIIFLTVEEVIEAHRQLVMKYGGSTELRDMGLLQSALATPAGMFGAQYLHEFPHETAGAYLFHLVSNHAFVDGNKRIGSVAARLFLLMNGLKFDPDEKEYGDLVLAVATGSVAKSDVAAFFEKHIRPA